MSELFNGPTQSAVQRVPQSLPEEVKPPVAWIWPLTSLYCRR